VDRDTFNSLYRLLISGVVFIALFSIFDNTPFIVRAIGDLFVVGGLLFLIDVDGGAQFKRFYWAALTIWIIIMIHAGVAFIAKSKESLEIFQTITFLMYALSLLSVPLFARAMQLLSGTANTPELEKNWKSLTWFSATYYVIPFVAFLGTSVGRAVGADVHLFYGVEETSNVPVDIVKYLLRVLFFLPLVLAIVRIHKTREVMLRVAP
jgi:hypothetical protein